REQHLSRMNPSSYRDAILHWQCEVAWPEAPVDDRAKRIHSPQYVRELDCVVTARAPDCDGVCNTMELSAALRASPLREELVVQRFFRIDHDSLLRHRIRRCRG